MNHHANALVHRYLDGLLSDSETEELNSWIKAKPENASSFAETARLHDRLRGIMQATAVIDSHSKRLHAQPIAVDSNLKGRARWRQRIAGGAAALFASILLVVWWINPLQVSAAAELDRLIEKVDTRDRTYVIHNLDDRPELSEERRPPIDGAVLHVRQPDQYVLIRKFPDGRQFVTGSDGEGSWSVPPNGAVRLSRDPLRFRGPVPGHQQGIPFANLRSDLVQLRDAYEISTLISNVSGQRCLLGVKRSPVYRGPNRVELWYDPGTGVILRMVFRGMPKARGGPDRVSVELLEQRELGNEFFQHSAHHSPERRVAEDDG